MKLSSGPRCVCFCIFFKQILYSAHFALNAFSWKYYHLQKCRRFAGRKLNDRTAKQIHHRLATLFHPAKLDGGETKKWTEEEDVELAYLYSLYGPSWVKIGSILGRPEKHCEIRYRDHHTHYAQSGFFTIEERRKFIGECLVRA